MLPISAETREQLTDKEAAFVDALVRLDGDKKKAAIQAGYSKRTARQQAYEVLRKPKVVQALLERTALDMVVDAPKARATLSRLLDAKSDYVALEAAKDLLDRAGFKPREKVDHRVSGEVRVEIDLS